METEWPRQRCVGVHKFDSFREFWSYYLREHAHAETRALHVAGTGLSLVCLIGFLHSLGEPRQTRQVHPALWLASAAVAGYGPAWIGHFLFEGNRPASFAHPLWSLAADFRLAWLWATGQLENRSRPELGN